MSARKVGVFGGTFDPIHIGHLYVAQAVLDRAGLARILFVPMAMPAHRETHAAPAQRRAMVELAIAGNPHFALDTTGLEQQAPAYTADTLALMRAKDPESAFTFVAGIDALTRSTWRRLDEVALAVERFIVVSREGVDRKELDDAIADLPAELRARFSHVGVPLTDVSSTAIRAEVRAGHSIRYLVPDAVEAYIKNNALYK